MLHHLFYFGVLLPTLIIIIFFIIFLICWYPLNLRQRFTKPKFKGGCHNSTHTSLASATSNYPNSKEYWDQLKLSRSETRQTTLSACTKYVPGEFPGSNDEDWRYMSRKSIDEEICDGRENGEVLVRDWLRAESTESIEQWQNGPGQGSRHARTNYALLDDEMMPERTQSDARSLDYYSESHHDLSPLSDDTIDERPPRPDDDRHTSQLHFICGGHRNGYCPLVQNWDRDGYTLPRNDRHSPMELGAKYLVNADCSVQTPWSMDGEQYSPGVATSPALALDDRICTSFKPAEPTTSRFSATESLVTSFKYTDRHSEKRKTQNGYSQMTSNSNQPAVPLTGYSNDAHTETENKAYACSPYAVTEIRNPVISV